MVRVDVRPWSMKVGNGDTEADGTTVNPLCSGPSSGCLPCQLHPPQYPHPHPNVIGIVKRFGIKDLAFTMKQKRLWERWKDGT